jgi:hypothetical protein
MEAVITRTSAACRRNIKCTQQISMIILDKKQLANMPVTSQVGDTKINTVRT